MNTTSFIKIGIAGLHHQTKNYENACICLGLIPCTTLSLSELSTCDALILPGGSDITPGFYGQSNDGSRDINTGLDLKQFQALDLFVRLGKPVLGICKGLQVINVFFGGTLVQDLPDSSAHQQAEGDLIHPAVITEDCLLSELYGKEFLINSNHHQAIDQLGKNLQVVQMSRDGVVEAFRHTKLPIFAVQWHPERHKLIEINAAYLNEYTENYILSRENQKVSLPGNLLLHAFFTNKLIG